MKESPEEISSDGDDLKETSVKRIEAKQLQETEFFEH